MGRISFVIVILPFFRPLLFSSLRLYVTRLNGSALYALRSMLNAQCSMLNAIRYTLYALRYY